jgi:phosphoribosylamine--glycine ligase
MKVLVIGQGGREHALVRALSLSPSVSEIHALPGSDGIALSRNVFCHALRWQDFPAVHQLCARLAIDVVMIGPEDPLVMGLADFLRERNLLVVGPSQAAAQLEGSKVFAKEFMSAAGIPTAAYELVTDVASCLRAARRFAAPYVLKAEGLAAGKGVFICKTLAELEESAISIFEKKILGEAGKRAVLEEFTPGWELSYLILTNGLEYQSLPIAQDHKRLSDGDEGPNTGGMGTVAPLKISAELQEKIHSLIVLPTLREIQKRGYLYRGVIFFGLMINKDAPSLLEFNCRFGDPETQVILPLLENDLGVVLKELSAGKLSPLRFTGGASACVVMAAPGYPSQPQKGVVISGDLQASSASSYFLHAGTQKDDRDWVTSGGRVLNSVGVGATVREALAQAYLQAKKAQWLGLQMRKDIGAKFPEA